jgi:hypothetical protein
LVANHSDRHIESRSLRLSACLTYTSPMFGLVLMGILDGLQEK